MEKIRATRSNLPGAAIQAALWEWLQQVRNGGPGNPALLLTGLHASDAGRWKIGIEDAWRWESDPSKIVLKLPKPKHRKAPDRPAGEPLTTEYRFDQETAWLIQMHVVRGGDVRISASRSAAGGNNGKPRGYYYAGIRIPGLVTSTGRPATVNVDRLTSNAGAYRDANLADKRDYHNRTRANMKPTPADVRASEVGPENERSPLQRRITREDAIAASVKLWRAGGPFPSAAKYEAALRFVYDVLDQRHPLAKR